MSPKTAVPAEHKALPIYIVDVDEAEGVIDAVVNVFGIIDLGDDRIHNGAYVKTLNERGNKIKVRVLDSHNTDSILRVIGKPLEIREIGRDELARLAPKVIAEHPKATGGLFTKTQFLMDTPEGEGAFRRLASGAVDEWSIALDALQVEYTKEAVNGQQRTIREIYQIRLYEYSPVIWGMNQATVTTDVKTADPEPGEEKEMLIGNRLEADLRMAYAYCVNNWLACGMIDSDMISRLDNALIAGLNAFRMALPDDLANMPLMEMWGADGGELSKSGRMISAQNIARIQQAMNALQALLDAAMPMDDSEDMPEEDMPDSEPSSDKALTGSDNLNSVQTTPSIANAGEFALDVADIDRELEELKILMEFNA